VRFTRWLWILPAALVLSASASDVAGTWKVVWSGGAKTKTIGSIILILKTEGDHVTGTARLGLWPGDAPITDGKVEGSQITFTATGHITSTSGIPTCQAVATVHGEQMDLKLTFIAHDGVPYPPEQRREIDFTGKRMP
jgi:hypothetical protein